MSNRTPPDPLTRAAVQVWFDESTRAAIREFMAETDNPNASQAIQQLVLMGLGVPADRAALSIVRRAGFGKIVGATRQRLAIKLREIASEMELVGDDPELWEL